MNFQLKNCAMALCSLFIFLHALHSEFLSPEMGTIIVTYQTNHEGERLDRIRFWLINEHEERTLYPKRDEFVSNSHTPNERTVVITHLPAGRYQIEFLVPNADEKYEGVPRRSIMLKAGDVVKVDQVIRHRLLSAIPENDPQEIAYVVTNYAPPFYPPPSRPYPYSIPGSAPIPVSPASFSLTSNQPQAKWKLVLRRRLIYAGVGSVSNLSVPPGSGYAILAENIDGYSYYTSPKTPFELAPGQIVRMDLFYQRDTGYVVLQGEVPHQVKSLSITLYPQDDDRPPIPATLLPINHRISWESGPLPTGEYVLSINSSNISTPIPNQRFVVQKGTRLPLTFPSVIQKGSIQITADSSQALFTLTSEEGVIIGQGKGFNYTFQDLNPGNYLLRFTSSDPNLAPVIPSQQVAVGNQTASLKIAYSKLGNLTINSNGSLEVFVLSQKEQKQVLRETLTKAAQTFRLPEGRYLLSYQSLSGDQPSSKPIDVNIRAAYPVTLSLPLADQVKTGENGSKINKEPQKGERTVVEAVVVPRDAFAVVPAGSAMIGDPFSDDPQNERPAHEENIAAFAIAVYEVTNAQYADWLNEAMQAQKVIAGNPNLPGVLLNPQGQILCKTMEGAPFSQLTAQKRGNQIQVKPIPGKEEFPVIEVTWYGAQAYCQDNGFRLPTEAEWEKAAGMSFPKDNEKAKRFKYGFGQNVIDRSWANYRENERASATQVLTTPVGFYNGVNTLPLTAQDSSPLQTHDAKSPAGAYDMSGNVWEWVGNNNSGTQIVKGGCYDSLAQGVRVSERLALPSDYCDRYTGFRTAKSPP